MHESARRLTAALALATLLVAFAGAIVLSLASSPPGAPAGGPSAPSAISPGAVPADSLVYTVSGFVTNAANGAPVTGAHLFVSQGAATVVASTGANGQWSVALPDGNYLITATAVGYSSDQANVSVDGAPVGPVLLSLVQPTPAPGPSGSAIPAPVQMVLPFLPSAGVGLAGFVSWMAFIRTPPQRALAPLFR